MPDGASLEKLSGQVKKMRQKNAFSAHSIQEDLGPLC